MSRSYEPRPTVSVIMPTFNRADYIAEAITSVLAQDFQDLELIIADDGSTDDTEEVIRPLLDSRCFFHKLSHEGNISRLRNHGIGVSRGEYIAYLDSDDVWHHKKLSLQVDLLKTHHHIGLCCTSPKVFAGEKPPFDTSQGIGPDYRVFSLSEILRNKLAIYPSSILYKKEGLLKSGLHDESFRWNDLGFITRYVSHHGGMIIEQALTGIRKHDDNISTRIRAEAVGFRDMIHTTEILFNARMISRQERDSIVFDFHNRMGSMLREENQYSSSRDSFKKALAIKPRSVRTNVKFFVSFVQALLQR